jgi:hypothetical protein
MDCFTYLSVNWHQHCSDFPGFLIEHQVAKPLDFYAEMPLKHHQ